jgi:hypothetical protein
VRLVEDRELLEVGTVPEFLWFWVAILLRDRQLVSSASLRIHTATNAAYLLIDSIPGDVDDDRPDIHNPVCRRIGKWWEAGVG